MREQTVREIASTTPAAAGVFEKYKIDYCCGGQRPLEEACRERGISADAVLAEVEANTRRATGRDWSQANLSELVEHIVTTHHAYLRREMPALSERLERTVAKHGEKYPATLPRLQSVYEELRFELTSHLRKEEMVLFPAIVELEAAQLDGRRPAPAPFGSMRNPILMMEHEHDSAGAALRTIRELTGGFVPPADACTTFRAVYAGLAEMEQDLHTHIHLENNILFPRAAELERLPG